jgi:hypothetical protein
MRMARLHQARSQTKKPDMLVEERVIESLIGCTDDARFIVSTLQLKLTCPTSI